AGEMLLEQTPQHPCRLLMDLHPLCEQIAGGLIADGFCRLEDVTRRPCHCLVTLHQYPYHVLSFGYAFVLSNRRQRCELLVRAWRWEPEGSDTFGDEIDCERQLVVVRLEHQVQRLKHGPRHVPVEVVRLEVERVRVSQNAG